jgi:hypothetical protein
MSFEFSNLAARYDRSDLVPFIGSGMSVPACATWKEMVVALENKAGLALPKSDDLIWRSQRALESLRASRDNVGQLVYDCISVSSRALPPPQTELLASLYWPLVCTTNYDDVYLRAVMAREGRSMPQVFGRSEEDCRRVLQHLGMPVHEAVWALQGFLGGRNEAIRKEMPLSFDHDRLESEIVVGHAEYRKAANRSPHFRRCFAEVFRTKSFLFLGTGLSEPYFLSLFDEIIELVGPPKQPHFALVPEGRVDADFMLRHYHIICRTYSVDSRAAVAERHAEMQNFLSDFCSFIRGYRTRGCEWGYRLGESIPLKVSRSTARFSIQKHGLPESLDQNEAMAVSCGRARDRMSPDAARGVALAGRTGLDAVSLPKDYEYEWLDDSNWVVKFKGPSSLYGIVARELVASKVLGERPPDRRSPDAIRQAFYNFLEQMTKLGVRTVYVQLLAAGRYRTFHPWVSLVQMARAYGEWHRVQLADDPFGHRLIDVNICAADPSVFALLQGNFIDLGEQLEATLLRVTIEVIQENQEVVRHYRFIESTAELSTIIPHVDRIVTPYPSVYALPEIRRERTDADFLSDIRKSVRDFGLVSGSTLVIDFSRQGSEKTCDACRELPRK